jgi:ribosomal protein S18 acetylase RimI-like enzyme
MFEISIATGSVATDLAAFAAATFRESWLEEGNENDLEEYVTINFNKEQLLAEINNASIKYLILKEGETWVGYAKIEMNASPVDHPMVKSLALHRIYIKKSFQSQNAGSGLISEVELIAKENGLNSIWLGVWNQNHRAIKFYHKHGFKEFGTYKFIMGKAISEDYLMKKTL